MLTEEGGEINILIKKNIIIQKRVWLKKTNII